jgi:hypothetical protein
MDAHGGSPSNAEILAEADAKRNFGRPDSAFVAVRALLGFEVFRRHAKHVIALDANAMQNALGVTRRRACMGTFALRLGRFAHAVILTQASSEPRDWLCAGRK